MTTDDMQAHVAAAGVVDEAGPVIRPASPRILLQPTPADAAPDSTPGTTGLESARRRPAPLDTTGLAVAAAFVCLSLSPSLLPRSPVFQGWLSGIVAATGYGLGTTAAYAVRRAGPWPPGPRARRACAVVVGTVAPAVVGGFLVAGRRWQVQAHAAVGDDPPGRLSPLLIVALTITVLLVLVAAARLIRAATVAVTTALARHLPTTVAALAGVLLVAIGVGMLLDQVVLRAALMATDRVAAAANDEEIPELNPPASALRSGGPGSLVAWDDLGLQGRKFVTAGPTQAQITHFTGRPAQVPIRVYVGLAGASGEAERARQAVAELDRTGAFDRAILCVVTTTGTGWVDPQAAAALELLHGGDTAIVTTQYSYLPSPVSFLFDDDQVEKEGAELFAQIRRRWEQLPPDARPKLFLYGESLGSNGGQAALGDPSAHRADGALFVGAPGSNRLRQNIAGRRLPGSPERLPVSGERPTVRFAADEQSLSEALQSPWAQPRVLFLQHSSDPVVWWSPDLLFKRPDWLKEKNRPGVSSSMSWYPVVTFWQVTADLVESNRVPPGAGHRYGTLVADAWAAIAPPDGWTTQDTVRLRQAVTAL
jgi:uncharacterized membrane protein